MLFLSLNTFFETTESIQSRSFSISSGGGSVRTQARSTDFIHGERCEPTVSPENVYSIPNGLLLSVYEANLTRFSNFCSSQYISDPRGDIRTSRIRLVLWLIV